MIAAVIAYIIDPDLNDVMEGIKDDVSENIKESIGIDKVWSYVVNNGFMVPLQMFIFSLIPIQFLYSLNIISSVSILGVLFGIVLQTDHDKGIELIISSIPHYIFEIFAFCLLASVLFDLNQAVRVWIRNIFTKDKEETFLFEKFLKKRL